MNSSILKRAACLLALAGVTFTYASAKEPADATQPNAKAQRPGAATSAAEAAIPACLERLKLTGPQQSQAKEIVGKYESKINAVWKQFGGRYMETIKMEVSLLAAIEDNLTETQRTKVRDQRRKTAHAEQASEGGSEKPIRGAAKPVDAVKEEIDAVGVSLTSEQEAAADKIHEKYLVQLRAMKRDIQGLHTKLVSLEADKLVELEKMLTKEQLAQLREGRQTATAAAKVTATE